MAYSDVTTEKSYLRDMRKFAVNFGKARGYQTLDLTDAAAHTLTVPANCNYAMVRLKTTSPSANTPVAWYRMDGPTVTADNGIPCLGWEMFDITDYENLSKFSIIGITGTEKLYIQYFNLQY